MSENSRLQARLEIISALYEQAIVLAREEGERNAYEKCEKAISAELNKLDLNWSKEDYGSGIQCALELIRRLR